MHTFECYLKQTADSFPDKTAVVYKGMEMSYAELWKRIAFRKDEMSARGIRQGEAVAFRTTQSVDFLITYSAIHLAGGVAVPLESDMPEERFLEVKVQISQADIPAGTADILYTTGTTGRSKGVMVSHAAVVANAENLIEAQGFSSDLTFIISGPLNHIGSLSKVWPVFLTGGTLYITEGMKDMNAFWSAFDYPCSRFAFFLVPASIRMLLSFSASDLKENAEAIEFVETGAAPMAQADMEQLCRLLPHSRLYNTYASTETGIVCTYDYNRGKCLAGCLGKAMKHSRVFITEEGTVACQGKTLMTGYVGDADSSRSALRDGTVYTHDNGFIDADGMLHLSGRSDDVINIGGFKVAPSEVEDAALSLPEIADCVCISVPHPVMGNVLKLLVVLADGGRLDKKKIARCLHSQLEAYKVPALYEEVRNVHRTFNGKINRKYYYQNM